MHASKGRKQPTVPLSDDVYEPQPPPVWHDNPKAAAEATTRQ